jgi:rare lipoprotein A
VKTIKAIRRLIFLATLTALAYFMGMYQGYGMGFMTGHSQGFEAGLQAPREIVVMEKGIASWYGPGFHGRRASDGSIYDQRAFTAAHRTLPFGTRVRVTNLHTGRSVVVTITDRGPYIGQRAIDLSRAGAEALGMVRDGLAKVEIRVIA